MVGLTFTSCSKDEFLYDSEAQQKILEAEYEANFIKRYGAIDPNQTWDFSTMQPTVSLPSSGASVRANTRGETDSNDFTTGNIIVDKDVIHYFLSNLPKGNNNTPKGRVFKMYSTGKPFTIVPVFQGCASYYWELWISIEGFSDQKIWSKGENFKYRKVNTAEWLAPGTGKEGMKREYGDLEVNAPTFTFSGIKTQNLAMSFYLKVWKTYSNMTGYEVYLKNQQEPNNTNYYPVISSSLDNWMIDLQNATKPTNLPEGNKVTIIGCEDATNSGSDRDFEDLVFMVYGNPVPPTERVTEVIKSTTKRYMMEDLGETDDFDFNDVVVDVEDYPVEIHQVTRENGVIKTDEVIETTSAPSQAIIRAMGGTIDFELTIGETKWVKSENNFDVKTMYNTQGDVDYNKELAVFEVKGYDYNANNVGIRVKGQDGLLFDIKFPKAGEAPMIIAVDPSQQWMKERVSVPSEWLY